LGPAHILHIGYPIGDIFVLHDGRRCFADDADESFIEQWEADYEAAGAMVWDDCTLSELSALISPHLNKGTIEFVAVCADDREISHERLLVRSDGSAEWHKCCSCNDYWDAQSTPWEVEYYEPKTQRPTARIAPEGSGSIGRGPDMPHAMSTTIN
jgi:hypothetical protein